MKWNSERGKKQKKERKKKSRGCALSSRWWKPCRFDISSPSLPHDHLFCCVIGSTGYSILRRGCVEMGLLGQLYQPTRTPMETVSTYPPSPIPTVNNMVISSVSEGGCQHWLCTFLTCGYYGYMLKHTIETPPKPKPKLFSQGTTPSISNSRYFPLWCSCVPRVRRKRMFSRRLSLS